MNYLTQIDNMLSLFEHNKKGNNLTSLDVIKKWNALYAPIDTELLNEIMFTLQKDDYIRLEEYDAIVNGRIIKNVQHYYLTFKGGIFKQSGSYTGEFSEKNGVARRDRLTFFLAWILAVGVYPAFWWYLIDIVKNYYADYIDIVCLYFFPYGTVLFLLWLLYSILKSIRIKQK